MLLHKTRALNFEDSVTSILFEQHLFQKQSDCIFLTTPFILNHLFSRRIRSLFILVTAAQVNNFEDILSE